MYIGSTGQRGLHHLVRALGECSVRAPLICEASLIICIPQGSLSACTQVYEILDNAIDEVQAGHADTVQVSAVTKMFPLKPCNHVCLSAYMVTRGRRWSWTWAAGG